MCSMLVSKFPKHSTNWMPRFATFSGSDVIGLESTLVMETSISFTVTQTCSLGWDPPHYNVLILSVPISTCEIEIKVSPLPRGIENLEITRFHRTNKSWGLEKWPGSKQCFLLFYRTQAQLPTANIRVQQLPAAANSSPKGPRALFRPPWAPAHTRHSFPHAYTWKIIITRGKLN